MDSRQLVNKGSHLDNDEAFQPKDTYRHAVNGMLISYNDGNYSWQNAKGNSLSFDMGDGYKIIGWCNLREDLIVFSTNETVGSIDKIVFDSDNKAKIQPIYALDSFNFTENHPIVNECEGYYESQTIQRIYWTDFYNKVRSLNIAEVNYVSYIDNSVKLVNYDVNKTYVVVYGEITINSVTYTKGQKFTSTTIPTIPSDVVIAEYISANSMNSTPDVTWGEIELHSINKGGGNVGYGQYFFCYQFYSLDGRVTNWSPLSNGLAMLELGDSYQKQQGGRQLGSSFGTEGAGTTDGNSGNSFTLRVKGVDAVYEYIRFGVFSSSAYNTIDTNGYTFYSQKVVINTDGFVYADYKGASEHGDKVSLVDILQNFSQIQKAKTLCITQGYLIIANIVENGEFDLGVISSASVTAETMELVSDTKGNITDTTSELTGHNIMKSSSDVVYTNQWYRVISEPVSYNGVNQPKGSFFKGVESVLNYVGAGKIQPYLRIKKYRKKNNEIVYDNIELTDGYLDYKNPLVAEKAQGYWGGETYRIGVLPFDLQGRPLHVRWLKDIDIPQRSKDVTGIYNNTKGANSNTSLTSLYRGGAQVNLGVMSIVINGLDITSVVKDDISQISAISIVRCSREDNEQTLFEGLLQPIVHTHFIKSAFPGMDNDVSYNFNDNETHIADGFARHPFGQPLSGKSKREPKTYCLYSPDRMFYLNETPASVGDSLRVSSIWGDRNDLAGLGTQTNGYTDFQQKFIKEVNSSDTTIKIGDSTVVRATVGLTEFDGAKNNGYVNISLFNGKSFGNDTLYSYAYGKASQQGSIIEGTDSYYRRSKITRGVVVQTETEETATNHPNGYVDQYGASYETTKATYVQYKRTNNVLYGGTTDEAKAASLYSQIGHYLPITKELLSDIEDNGKYILNDVQVFGGDCFVTLFDFTLGSYDRQYDHKKNKYNPFVPTAHLDSWQYSVAFPVQSKVNTCFRYGIHASKNRNTAKISDGNYANPSTGVRADVATQIENYNKSVAQNSTNEAYLSCYSTDRKNASYGALPVNFEFETEFDARVMWSERKNNGEAEDAFMKFPTGNMLDVETNRGYINNVRTEANRLFYWQQHGVGSIPINERQLMTGVSGEILNLGIDDRVGLGKERYDERHSFYGNQHQHSLIKTTNGFAWFDFANRAFIHMSIGLSINNDSIIKGYYQLFRNEISNALANQDNPVTKMGIVSGYDEMYRTVYMTFSNGSEYKTIAFNDILNSFVGEHTFQPTLYAKLHGRFITTNGHEAWLHNAESSGRGSYFGEVSDSMIELIVNQNFDMSKIFDTFMLEGNDKFFYKIECETLNQKGVDDDIVDKTTLELLSDNVEYRNQSWVGNFPLTEDSDRFVDNWLKIRFYFDNNKNELVKLLSLQTGFRKAY